MNASSNLPNNETSYTPSSEKPIVLDGRSSNRSLTNAKPLERESLELSQSSYILKSIDPEKRRFFRPLADAITASDSAQLGKILLRLCVEYPNTRAVVESLFADTSNEDVDASSPTLTCKISNYQAPQDSTPVTGVKTTPLPPVRKQNKSLEEKEKTIAVAKPTKKVPQTPQIPTSARTSVAASEKRKREESSDTSIISQKKSKPHSVTPKYSKLSSSVTDQKDGTSKPSTSSSKSLNTSKGSKLMTDKPVGSLSKPKPDRTSLDSLFDSNYSEAELSSGKYICKVTNCGKGFSNPSILDEHIKAVHKSEGKLLGCSLCTRKFTRRVNFHRHLEVAHTSNDLECTACRLKYRDSDRLSAHMRSEHGVRYVEDKTNQEPSTVPNSVKKTVGSKTSR